MQEQPMSPRNQRGPKPSTILLFAILLMFTASSWGEIVRLQMRNGLEATAELLQGRAEGKVVLIVHGFLQTRDFFTVRQLAEALHDMGHTVLLPNLTLGINHRRQSLACEAIHTHSMGQDTAEIALWIDWLHHRSGREITLIGHSLGSLMGLAYLAENTEAPVAQVILVSLLSFGQGPIAKETPEDLRRATLQIESHDDALTNYHLAFCDEYVTKPEKYLSYVRWNSQKALQALKASPIKAQIVLGGEDRRLGEDWGT
jgi:pimeloyl-ACP methyl ester carboxylesterase